MNILSIDLGKYKSVFCMYETTTNNRYYSYRMLSLKISVGHRPLRELPKYPRTLRRSKVQRNIITRKNSFFSREIC